MWPCGSFWPPVPVGVRKYLQFDNLRSVIFIESKTIEQVFKGAKIFWKKGVKNHYSIKCFNEKSLIFKSQSVRISLWFWSDIIREKQIKMFEDFDPLPHLFLSALARFAKTTYLAGHYFDWAYGLMASVSFFVRKYHLSLDACSNTDGQWYMIHWR